MLRLESITQNTDELPVAKCKVCFPDEFLKKLRQIFKDEEEIIKSLAREDGSLSAFYGFKRQIQVDKRWICTIDLTLADTLASILKRKDSELSYVFAAIYQHMITGCSFLAFEMDKKLDRKINFN